MGAALQVCTTTKNGRTIREGLVEEQKTAPLYNDAVLLHNSVVGQGYNNQLFDMYISRFPTLGNLG